MRVDVRSLQVSEPPLHLMQRRVETQVILHRRVAQVSDLLANGFEFRPDVVGDHPVRPLAYLLHLATMISPDHRKRNRDQREHRQTKYDGNHCTERHRTTLTERNAS